MKNFVTFEEFLPALKSSRTLTVTTEYSRPDTTTPFVNSIVLNRAVSEGLAQSEKVGVSKFQVKWVK